MKASILVGGGEVVGNVSSDQENLESLLLMGSVHYDVT